ncbi:hypothetical protein EGC79_03450 [Shewanella vesiculosa]|nr:hypothetical protein EGC79_03450 [Shewanella vesiculosa]
MGHGNTYKKRINAKSQIIIIRDFAVNPIVETCIRDVYSYRKGHEPPISHNQMGGRLIQIMIIK